jgi:tRNA A-37 threonylcarbamoyl transferase component Bud32/predicted methyltransferase
VGKLDDTVDDVAPVTVGSVLGAYRIEARLGEGAMGQVFRATHTALSRVVAIKMLKPEVAADPALTERFFAEARAVNIIRHENIVECTDLVHDPSGRSYIVMELLEGRTLGAAAREAGRMPVPRAARIMAQIADAIGAAHGKGIIHRDLKPENVFLIQRAGSADYVKVLDFGIARLRPEVDGTTATQTGAPSGTPAYMSPEQVRGNPAVPASDIYALGVIAFQLVTGRLPFEQKAMSAMLAAQLEQPAPRADALATVSTAFADAIDRALAKDPAKRPADMAAFRRALLVAAGLPTDPVRPAPIDLEASTTTGVRKPAPVERVEPADAPRRRPRWPWLIAAAIAASGLAIAAVAMRTASERDTPVAPAPIDLKQAQFDAERAPAKLVEIIGIQPGWKVADIGADNGLLTVHLARAVGPTGKVVATDVEVLDLLIDRIERAGLSSRVEPRVVDAETPGLEPATYNAIVVAEVDHYFGDPVAWFAAAAKALVPGGKLAISNKLHHKDRATAAARKAGLVLLTETALTQTHYLAVFSLGDAPDTKTYECAPGKPGTGECSCSDGYESQLAGTTYICSKK